MLYVSLIYSLGFFVMLFLLFRAIRKTPSSVFEDAFYMLSAFALCKGASAFLEIQQSNMIAGSAWVSDITARLSIMFSITANVFLFHSAIDFLLYKLHTKLKFRVVPLLMFSGYLVLYMSNIIKAEEIEKIGRFSFGYNSAILNSIAMFNLYYIIKQKPFGLIFAGIGFILYAVSEGIPMGNSIFGIDIRILKLICVLALVISSFYIRSLLQLEKKSALKIGYV